MKGVSTATASTDHLLADISKKTDSKKHLHQIAQTEKSSPIRSNTLKIETEKVTYPICIQHYKPLDLIAFALVNRQLQIYTIRQTVAKLLFEPRATIRTEQMAVCMSVETHKVSDRLLCCLGFQYDLI